MKQKKTERFETRQTVATKQRLEILANHLGISMNAVVERGIWLLDSQIKPPMIGD